MLGAVTGNEFGEGLFEDGSRDDFLVEPRSQFGVLSLAQDLNDLGFSTTAERLDGGMRVGYREIRPGSVFRNYNLTVSTFHNWSHEALDDTWSVDSWQRARLRGSFRLNTNWQLLNYWNVKLIGSYSPQAMSRSATRGGPMMVDPASTDFSLNVSSDRRKSVSFGSNFQVKDDLLGTGGSTNIRGDIRLRPSDNLGIS